MADSTASDSTNDETLYIDTEEQDDTTEVHPGSGTGKTAALIPAQDRGREEKVLLGKRKKKDSPPDKPQLDSLEDSRNASGFVSTDQQQQVISKKMQKVLSEALKKEKEKIPEQLHQKTEKMLQFCLYDSEEADSVTLDVIRPLIESMKRYCISECLLIMSELKKSDIETFGEAVINLVDAVHKDCVDYRRYKGSFCREWREAVRDLMLIASDENESEAQVSQAPKKRAGDVITKVAQKGEERSKKKRSKRKRKRKRARGSSSVSVASVQFNYLMPPAPLQDNRVVTLLQPYRKGANEELRKQGRSRTRFTLSYDMQAELGLLDEPQFNPRVMADSSGLRKFIDSLGDTELKLLDDVELVKVS